jgi:hypothetical protein
MFKENEGVHNAYDFDVLRDSDPDVFSDNKKHSVPQIHAEYGEYEATIAIENGFVLGGGAFKELVNDSYFRLVRPAHHGIAWPHEQDFSADTIIWDIQSAQQGACTRTAIYARISTHHLCLNLVGFFNAFDST